jgi:hypothetical protein
MAASAEKTAEDIALEKELILRRRFRDDFRFFAPNALKIRPKGGDLIPFEINQSQLYLHLIAEKQLLEKGRVRIIVLKGRQQGVSTYVAARFYWKVTHRKGAKVFILTHEIKATENLFEMAKRYHDNNLPDLKPSTKSESMKTLTFNALDSGYAVGTAGTKGVGRSSTIQYFHGSEVAFWDHADTHATGVLQGVPTEDQTEVFLESTANGMGNYFHSQWQLAERGESDFIPVFLCWYWMKEYTRPCDDDFELTSEEFDLLSLYKKDGLTAEHLNWRRYKIMEFEAGGESGEWRFKQEYPMNAAEAFQTSGEESLIAPEYVLTARKQDHPMSGPHIVGVDPARFGKDRTAVIHRNGRKMYGHKWYRKKSTMQVAGICANILTDAVTGERTDVDMMFIDIGGLGAGVYDRLVELGYGADDDGEGRVIGVNSSSKPLEDSRYVNKRAEMGCLLRNWFQQPGGVDIEDVDVLQTDLCGPRYSYDSAGRTLIEKKEAMMKRGVESPDFFDAAALTFAEPVGLPNQRNRRARANVKPVDYGV